MEEQKTLTEQILDTPQPEAPAVEQPADNGQMADAMLSNLMKPFTDSLDKLSNKQLRRVISTILKFPFIEKTARLKTKEEQISFVLGERLLYANMVKRTKLELERTFGEVEKEIAEEKTNNPIPEEIKTNE